MKWFMKIGRLVAAALLMVIVLAGSGWGEGEMKRFRLVTVDGGVVEGANGLLDGDLFSGTTRAGDRFEIRRDRVIQLEDYRGNRTGAGLAIGVLSGLTLGVVYMLLNEDEEDEDAGTVSKTVAIFGSLGAVGGVIGATIGGAVSKWEPVSLGRGSVGVVEGGIEVVWGF